MATRKRILITGAAGFLGSHLCDRFIKEDYHVIGMDNLITGDLRNIEHLFKLENFEFYNHDVSKFVYVPGELHYILHFARHIYKLGNIVVIKLEIFQLKKVLDIAQVAGYQ